MATLVCVPSTHCCLSEQFCVTQQFIHGDKKRSSSSNGTDREPGNRREIENSASCQVGERAEHQLTQSSPGRGAALGVNGTIFHFLGGKNQAIGQDVSMETDIISF